MSLYKTTLENYLLSHPILIQPIKQLISTSSQPISLYLCLASLRKYLLTNPMTEQIENLILNSFEQFSCSQLKQLLNLQVWKDQSQLKNSSNFVRILGDWIQVYEEKISKPEIQNQYFTHILEFINTKTSTIIERIVFFEQTFDDLQGIINLKYFWTSQDIVIQKLETPIQNLDSLLGILEVITFKSIVRFKFSQEQWYYNPLLADLKSTNLKYQQFVFRGMIYVLLHSSMLNKVQKNLTLAVLRFVTWTQNDQWVKILLTRLITKTSKAVKFALSNEYQLMIQALQYQNRHQLIEALQQIKQIRDLIKKKLQIQTVEFQQYERNIAKIGSGQQKQYFFEVTKLGSILFFEYYVDIDISVKFQYIGDLFHKESSVYLEQSKSKNKSFQVLLNKVGIHRLVFDNSYSWVTAKNVCFSLNVFKPFKGDNSDFNLLTYTDQYTPWNQFQLPRSQQQKYIISIWKSIISQKSDIIFRNNKSFFQGVLSDIQSFDLSQTQIKSIKTILIVGNKSQYQQILSQIKQINPSIKIRQCDDEDFQ